jgi:hypothetical protein
MALADCTGAWVRDDRLMSDRIIPPPLAPRAAIA